MQGEEVKKLLLSKSLPDGQPLFRSAAEIAAHITEEPHNTRKATSVTTLLSAFFSNFRAVSVDFRLQLLAAITKKLQRRGIPAHHAQHVLKTLDTLILRHNAEMRALRDRIPGMAPSIPEETQVITAFFERVAEAGGLLCVEYRVPSRIYGDAKYSSLMETASRAIVSGASLAMFLPFQADPPAGAPFLHAARIHTFIRELRQRLRYGCGKLLERCTEMAKAEGINPKTLRNRIVLYQLNPIYPMAFASGIQTRMFYATYRNPATEIVKEAWEWVAGEERDYFLQRDKEIIPLLSAQFDPIAGYWHTNGELPTTPGEMADAIAEFNKLYDAHLASDVWQATLD